MKLTKVKFFYATLVALGIAVMPANAAVDSTWDANDVILGFRADTGTTGAGSTLLVNLGSATTYRDTVANINSIANLGSVISSTYGSSWYERADLWAGFISATNGQPSDNSGGTAIASQTTDYNSTIYVSMKRSAAGTLGAGSGTRPGNASALDAQAAGALIDLVRQNTASKDGAAGDSDATAGIAVITSGQTNSWNEQATGSTAADFGVFNIETNFATGVRFLSFGGVSNVEQAWDFYRVAAYPGTDANAGKGIYQGTFTLDQNGGVDFIVTAVPEPSTYALIALTGVFYLFVNRRRKAKL
jgi:hypothetical protein